jgi:hypothetical protein
MQPAAQAVGTRPDKIKPQRGERKATIEDLANYFGKGTAFSRAAVAQYECGL